MFFGLNVQPEKNLIVNGLVQQITFQTGAYVIDMRRIKKMAKSPYHAKDTLSTVSGYAIIRI